MSFLSLTNIETFIYFGAKLSRILKDFPTSNGNLFLSGSNSKLPFSILNNIRQRLWKKNLVIITDKCYREYYQIFYEAP